MNIKTEITGTSVDISTGAGNLIQNFNGVVTVKWSFEYTVPARGAVCPNLGIISITGEYELEDHSVDDGKTTIHELDCSDWEILLLRTVTIGDDSIYPREVELNLVDKIATVYF